MASEHVDVSNFARAESNRMFSSFGGDTGVWTHTRAVTTLDNQPVIRQNRDTLYSSVIVDLSQTATVTLPDAGDRYLSVMVVNQDHFINRIYHEAGTYELTLDEFDTQFVCLAARIFVDPNDPDDVRTVNALQDQLVLDAPGDTPFVCPDYDVTSFDGVRNALLQLARFSGGSAFANAFGSKDSVDPIMHLIGTAAGWGGLPPSEAMYLSFEPDGPLGEYKIEFGEVPVGAFWSVSLYNRAGYFEENARGLYNVNSITADRNADGTVTINFGVSDADKPNYFPIMDGWNYTVRLYQPSQSIIDGTWKLPSLEPA